MSNYTPKKGLFTLENGQNLVITFSLISSLFLLWGLCNGMIDVMDKHFQDELGLSKSQSAWVQFAHYLGYFLMALPAGWLASKLGYKGGIIAGLLMVAVGGLWFVPAAYINEAAQAGRISATTAFIGYLAGVCAIAAGLTFLETVANPYTTVLGPPEYAATRINLAQSCNGIGWILGPIIGGLFFYAQNEEGISIGSEMLYIPYVLVAITVIVLAGVFYFAYIPDIKTKDDYHLDETEVAAGASAPVERGLNRPLVYALSLLNVLVLVGISCMFLWLVLSAFSIGDTLESVASWIPRPASMKVTPDNAALWIVTAGGCVAALVAAAMLVPSTRTITHHSIWSHPHFSGSTVAQFLYVAAQAGIFSFFINYMTSEVPAVPEGWRTERTEEWIEVNTAYSAADVKDLPRLVERLKAKANPLSTFVYERLSEATRKHMDAFDGSTWETRSVRSLLVQDLNQIVKQNPKKAKPGEVLYREEALLAGIALGSRTQALLAQKLEEDKAAQAKKEAAAAAAVAGVETKPEPKPEGAKAPAKVNLPLLNRLLLQDAFPDLLDYKQGVLAFSEKGASFLLSVAFICFLVGRFSGAALLKKFSAHKILGLYGLLNVVVCLVIFAKWGWVSVICVFLSFFFMSITFPTIFALGIFGLGARAKKASAYLVMAIMGGAVLPKLMGYVADQYDMSRGFIVPMVCFIFIALYGFSWPLLSGAKSLSGVSTTRGH